MELDIVDQLLSFLVEQPRNVPMAMRSLGYNQDQIHEAWTNARAAHSPNRPGSAWIGSHPPDVRGRQQSKTAD